MPEAFITATRQAVAQKHQWSLEELRLEVDINKHGDADAFAVSGKRNNFVTLAVWTTIDPTFYFCSGLKLEGAKWDNALQLTSTPLTKLELTQIRWVLKTDVAALKEDSVSLPVYLNSDRSDLLFVVNVDAKASDKNKIAQRAVAIVVWWS